MPENLFCKHGIYTRFLCLLCLIDKWWEGKIDNGGSYDDVIKDNSNK